MTSSEVINLLFVFFLIQLQKLQCVCFFLSFRLSGLGLFVFVTVFNKLS